MQWNVWDKRSTDATCYSVRHSLNSNRSCHLLLFFVIFNATLKYLHAYEIFVVRKKFFSLVSFMKRSTLLPWFTNHLMRHLKRKKMTLRWSCSSILFFKRFIKTFFITSNVRHFKVKEKKRRAEIIVKFSYFLRINILLTLKSKLG